MSATQPSVDGVVMEAIGRNGRLQLLDNPPRLRIVRKGMFALVTQGIKGDKEILLSRISSIQFKKPSFFSNGYMQIGFIGGRESKGGRIDATTDENTVIFSARRLKAFRALKAEMERRMESAGSLNSLIVPQPDFTADEIKKLADLRASGALTEEEFVAGKKKILGI